MPTETIIRIPKLFSEKGKAYQFTDNALIITNDAFQNAKTEIPKEKIISLRFGIKWIRGSHFVIGRRFTIELKLDNNTIIPLKFSSYYGIKKKQYSDKFQELINAVWEHLFQSDIMDITERFKNGETLYINGIEFNKEGLRWDEKEFLSWDKLKLNNYRTYFAISHSDNAKFNKSFYFLTDWDSFMLQQVVKHILQQRLKYTDQKFKINPN